MVLCVLPYHGALCLMDSEKVTVMYCGPCPTPAR